MRRLLALAALLPLACDSTPSSRSAQPAQAEIRTINNTPPRPAKLDPPPVLTDELPPPKPKALPWETPTPIVFSPEDEKLRASLPFTPAIAMDPINGDKISIRAATPTFEYKGKIYYFTDEANKRAFMANPDSFLTGKFTKL
jgi:YHS domain-containing protein